MPPQQAKKIFAKMHEAVENPEAIEKIKKEVKKIAREEEPKLNRLMEWEREKESKE